MSTVVGVRFRKNCKIYHFDPLDTGVAKGEAVIVETIRGLEYGTVVIGPKEVPEEQLVSPLKPILRKATENDTLRLQENIVREKEAFHICERKIQNHGLEMHLIDVEFTFDVSKIIFYFTADGRVDFRELVKDLASVFRTRIELRQIGVRDEAKMLGGIGYCGRPICCATFLGDFAPVSIRMAKNQGLSLNPTKISGICGRLMCCLDYEDRNYTENNDNQKDQIVLPKIGSIIATSLGEGRVMGINRQNETVQVQLAPNNVVTVGWDEIIEPEDLGNA